MITEVLTNSVFAKPRAACLATALLMLGTSNAYAVTTATPVSASIEKFNTFTIKLVRTDIATNKFHEFPMITFTKGTKSFAVEGFFDGDENGDASGNVWKARFMPDEIGTWNYAWDFNGDTGNGSFSVVEQSNSLVRGHVHRSGRFLKADDGKGFVFRGSNWPDTKRIRVNEADTSQTFISDTDWVNYVTRLSETKHNGVNIQAMDRLVNNDRASFDLTWTSKIDRAVQEAGKKGIYVVLGLFNTWSRDKLDPFATAIPSADQILDPWNNNLMAEKEFYLRYLAARFAGYYNIFWELGNEMEHTNSGGAFASLANNNYIPWLHKYDPYDLPMTLSEGIYTSINVDIGGLHQGQNISINETLPMIHSEQVGISGATDVLWGGQACRDPINRKYYRRTIWKGFFEGGSGSIECSLPFSGTAPFTTMADFLADSNVRNVMEDHGRLATLISLFKNDLTQLIPLSSSNLGSTPSSIKLRALSGSEYVGYFYGGLPSAGASITLSLPAGSFVAQWFSPSSGSISAMETVASGNTLTSPWGSEFDAILHVYSSAYVNMTLPTKVQGAQLTKTVK